MEVDPTVGGEQQGGPDSRTLQLQVERVEGTEDKMDMRNYNISFFYLEIH